MPSKSKACIDTGFWFSLEAIFLVGQGGGGVTLLYEFHLLNTV